eukprot:10978191-Lingulodinium_polyedra.AAC.1
MTLSGVIVSVISSEAERPHFLVEGLGRTVHRVGQAWLLLLFAPDGDATVHRGGVSYAPLARVAE